MSRLNLWLVRHGETEINSGVWNDKPEQTRLTFLGKEQAEKAAEQVNEQPDLFIVSPLIRANETMQFFINKWPDAPLITWPVQELMYLSPSRLALLAPEQRKEQIRQYWQKNDPDYCDGDDCESFASFMRRVSFFHDEISQQQGFVVVVGHGQFFKAFLQGLNHGFMINKEWMRLFRNQEVSAPIKNGEILKMYFN